MTSQTMACANALNRSAQTCVRTTIAEPMTYPSQLFLNIEDTGLTSQAQACANTVNRLPYTCTRKTKADQWTDPSQFVSEH